MATYYVDIANGNNSNSGTSASARVADLSPLTLNPGDFIRYAESGAPTTFGGADVTWTFGSNNLVLSTPVTLTVSNCETAWTPCGVNVSATVDGGSFRQGTASANITSNGSFTTGLMAYFPFSVTNYAGYQQITFWLQSYNTLSASQLSLCLCSDAAGTVPVNIFNIPEISVLYSWYPITINLGSALGSSIQSVALYANTSTPNTTILLDNIEAVPTGGLNLQSLIGKNTTGETWYGIRAILGTSVILDVCPTNQAPNPGYGGTTATVLGYKRETVKPQTLGSVSYYQNLNSMVGSSTSPITISGGWDAATMSSQTSETWFDGLVGQNGGFGGVSNYVVLDPTIACVRFSTGIELDGTNLVGSVLAGNNCSNIGVRIGGNHQINNVYGCAANVQQGLVLASNGTTLGNVYSAHSSLGNGVVAGAGGYPYLTHTGVIHASCNSNIGVDWQVNYGNLGNLYCNGNYAGLVTQNNSPINVNSLTASANISCDFRPQGAQVTINNYTVSPPTGGSINMANAPQVNQEYVLYNATYNVSGAALVANILQGYDHRVRSQNEQGILGNTFQYCDGGYIALDSASPHLVGGVDWQVHVTSTNRSSFYPLKFPFAYLEVNATTAVNFTIWAKLSSANIYAEVIIPGGQMPGLPNDISVPITSTSWAQYSLPFTPSTSYGAVQVYVYAYGLNGSVIDYVSIADTGISQS